jgi:hypothetical protein
MFDPNKPLFPADQQMAAVNEQLEFIALMKSSKSVEEWNLNRSIVKKALRANLRYYQIFIGYVDATLFPSVLKSWRQ